MAVLNGDALLLASPIKDMLPNKQTSNGVSFGLTEAGYDIRIKQEVRFFWHPMTRELCHEVDGADDIGVGRFCLASAIEEFAMCPDLVAIVHDKSTWARMGLSVFNTVIEPGWDGFLTLELTYHGQDELVIPAGSGIAQVIFHELKEARPYSGKYQNQEDRPVDSRFE